MDLSKKAPGIWEVLEDDQIIPLDDKAFSFYQESGFDPESSANLFCLYEKSLTRR